MKLHETFGDILSMSPLIQQQMKNENYHNNWHLKFILTHYINEFGQNPLLFMTMTNIESSVNRNTLSHHIQMRWYNGSNTSYNIYMYVYCVYLLVLNFNSVLWLQNHLKIMTLWHNLHNNFIQLKYHNYPAQMLEIIHFVSHAAYARLRFCIMHSVLLNEQQRCAHLDIASLLSLIWERERGKKSEKHQAT